MKRLTTLTALFTCTLGFAQMEFEEQRNTFTSLVSVHNLSCVTRFGTEASKHAFTELENPRLPSFLIELKHDRASVSGCDFEALNTLVDKAMRTRFGHAEAQVTVIKRLAKEPRLLDGQCIKNFQEQVLIDFNNGVVLETSLIGKLKPATGC